MRQQRCVGASSAVSNLNGWTANGESAISKSFVFDDFKQASHFLSRFTRMCQKTGINPSWSNVYNQVSVTIENEEFGQISTKEVDVAKYLDMLSGVRVTSYHHINDTHTLDQIAAKGGIEVQCAVNNQEKSTSLFYNDRPEHLKLE
uniref:4a-hydroxytetrahydrobiopterin dehydratase n=1 Tax=Strombidium inclinatum TaxID=197538 RepID=A0A7S3IJ40_9SPIT|mmetsp:Transcript_22409/g.34666  ORF Transcript_22409/g.34666 Transcript_22409/m.34666 type:complete len:146 (+) Transcript_22409:27-464(+)|eukprot:CAMPEP_0170495104 /NCGR_PEP_ID=MMETSP0208-20121228/15020_1 /TAXON_ID=197538 /ORGANISM="Strombidium inclinatum, Strain S3" /LENGTH=145 /DNA_ID=CAMNT_0010771247 /DNA_START=23 /DNA_END=460 /DNA_ORIENTATION=-